MSLAILKSRWSEKKDANDTVYFNKSNIKKLSIEKITTTPSLPNVSEGEMEIWLDYDSTTQEIKLYTQADCIYLYQNDLNVSFFTDFRALEEINGLNLLQLYQGEKIDTIGSYHYPEQVLKEMFHGCRALKSLDLNHFDTSAVTKMQQVFVNCMALTSLNIENWNIDNVTSMFEMFRNCKSLTEITLPKETVKNSTLNFDVRNMFLDCSSLTKINNIEDFKTSISHLFQAFMNCPKLQSLDLSKWDVSQATSMQSMFSKNSSSMSEMNYPLPNSELSYLNVSTWDTSNVTDMSFAFYGLRSLPTLDISNWNVSKVESFDHMFSHCYNLEGIDVSNWTTSSATNMNGMFLGVKNKVLDLRKFNTSKVKALTQIFQSCYYLEEILGLGGFETSNCICFAEMFYHCNSLKKLDLSSFDTRKATDGIKISANGGVSTTMLRMFANMNNIREIKIGPNFSMNGDGTTTDATHKCIFPTPNTNNVKDYDGKWYTISNVGYAPEAIPTLTVGTYYASPSDLRKVPVSLSNGILLDTIATIKEKIGESFSFKPKNMAEKIATIGNLPIAEEVEY